jgi:hypothetical protein
MALARLIRVCRLAADFHHRPALCHVAIVLADLLSRPAFLLFHHWFSRMGLLSIPAWTF